MLVTVVRKIRRAGSQDMEKNPTIEPGTVLDMDEDEAAHFVNLGACKLGDQTKGKGDAGTG